MEKKLSIYLDYAAATPMNPQVLDAMLPYFGERFANPSAPYSAARAVKTDMEDARARIAHLIGAKPSNIVFTAGATEANNLAFSAVHPDAHVLTSAIEHESVLACAKAYDHALIPVTEQGFVTAEALRDALTPRTELVSVALANGEIGTMQALRELAAVLDAERARRLEAGETRPLYLHTDASQAAATCMINISSLNADLITISAAKMYGPKQMGMLWAQNGIELRPLIKGGGQESGVRSGTENVAGVVGFARAFELARERRKESATRLEQLRDWLQRELSAAFPWAIITGPSRNTRRLQGLLHISFPGLEARRLVLALDQRGVAVGTGSACAASKMRTSHVLSAIGMPQDAADGSLRITLGSPTTREQVESAARIIIDVVDSECARLHIHSKEHLDG